MAEIRNLTRNGETFYPLTCTDAVVDRDGNPLEIVNDIFDISEYNASGTPPTLAKYSTLALALAAVPQSKQKGGMTIRYVQTSDNKYVQYRLTYDEWSTNTEDWSFCGNDVYVESPEFIEVRTDNEGKVLEGIKMDGTKVVGADLTVGGSANINGDLQVQGTVSYQGVTYSVCTSPEYVYALLDSHKKVILGIKTDGKLYADIASLDETTQALISQVEEMLSQAEQDIDAKIQVLIDIFSIQDNPEWIQVTTDSEGKILEGVTAEGKKKVEVPQEVMGVETSVIDNPEWREVEIDKDGRILCGIKKNGKTVGYENPISDKLEQMFLVWNGNQISNIYNAARYNNRSAFPHIPNGKDFQLCLVGDPHGEDTSVKRAIELTNYVESIEGMIILGDMFVWTPYDSFSSNYDKNGVDSLINNILPTKCKKPYYIVCGNHDAGEGRCVMYTKTHEQVYNTFVKPMIDRGFLVSGEYNTTGDWADRCYYYHDFDNTKIRLIVLYEYGFPLELADNEYWEPVSYDASKDLMQPGTTYTYNEGSPIILNAGGYKEHSFRLKKTVTTLTNSARGGDYTTVPYYKMRARQLFCKNQLDWLISTLNSTPDGYGIVIASHQCLMAHAHVTENKFSIGSDPNNPYHPREEGKSPDMMMDNDIIVKIVNAWKTKGLINEKVAAVDMPADNQYCSYLNVLSDGGYDYMYEITADFSNRTNNNAYFSNYINGHGHCDIIERSKVYTDQITIEATTGNPVQRYCSDCAVVMHPDSQAYDNITVFACSPGRIALARYGNASTFAGVYRDFEIINPNGN